MDLENEVELIRKAAIELVSRYGAAALDRAQAYEQMALSCVDDLSAATWRDIAAAVKLELAGSPGQIRCHDAEAGMKGT
jgi:hypothetical protein